MPISRFAGIVSGLATILSRKHKEIKEPHFCPTWAEAFIENSRFKYFSKLLRYKAPDKSGACMYQSVN